MMPDVQDLMNYRQGPKDESNKPEEYKVFKSQDQEVVIDSPIKSKRYSNNFQR